MAEVHVIGHIVGASGFENRNVFCKWGIHAGRYWEVLEGFAQGQTQIDYLPPGGQAVWSHPVDVHFVCRGLSGWPKLHLQVWLQDEHGRFDLCGYGFCHIPASPGMFDLDCPTWKPEGSLSEEVAAFFMGGSVRLKEEDVIYSAMDRFRLQTSAGGVVHLQLNVVTRGFERYNIQTG